MKHTNKFALPFATFTTILALGAALLLLLPGCVTTPEGKQVPDVKLMQAVAHNAAAVGTMLYLKAHPDQRAQFVLARDALSTLVLAGSFSTDDLRTALQKLPIKELQGDEGALIVGAAVTLWDAYGRQLTQLDQAKVFDGYILPVAKSILSGLDAGLAGK